MRIALFVICCCFASSLAWLAPERCRQGKSKRSVGDMINTEPLNLSAEEIAALQQSRLEDTYKNYTFAGVPIRASCNTNGLDMYSAFDCKFYTYAPRSIASVVCTSTDCKLTRAVSTVDTYTADEGYNWGVKASAKVTLKAIFEVGGEVSTGGSYRCAYTKGKTTTDTVQCSGTSSHGELHLYNVKTDMKCEFGPVTLEQDERDYAKGDVSYSFTSNEVQQIRESAASFFSCRDAKSVMIDTNLISSRLLEKLMRAFPKYNPYTDVLSLEPNFVMVNYYKITGRDYEYQKIIPFTNEAGDSAFQYACVFEKR